MRNPGLYIVDGNEEFVIPDTFPSSSMVKELIEDASTLCFDRSVMSSIENTLGPVLGSSNDIFNSSLKYKNFCSADLLEIVIGLAPVTQTLGRILFDEEVMKAFTRDTNCLIITESMENTYVSRDGDREVVVQHNMPLAYAAVRYLRKLPDVLVEEHGYNMTVNFTVRCNVEDTQGLTYILSNMKTILTVYYKLLTRFKGCPIYSLDLPKFQNTQTPD